MNGKIRQIGSIAENTRWFLPSLFFSCMALLFLRKPSYALFQPGRVEDVDVLLVQAIQYSWNSIFVVYNYYFHLVPRLVTLSSLSLLGIGNVHLGMNLSAIAIASLCAIFFATKQFRFIIKNDLLRLFCSLFIVLVPGINEIYSNISSIQWFLNVFIMLFVALLLFKYEEYERKSLKQKYLYAFFCAVSLLSSAFSVVFLPALLYVIARESRKSKKSISTIFSYAIPTILLLVQTSILCISYLQQSKSAIPNIEVDVLRSSVNAFAISASKIFYYNTPNMYQNVGNMMYVIPIVIVAFILLNSIKNGIRFEIYALASVFATLFFSSLINKQGYVDWNCLCGTAQERYFSLAIIFLFILFVRQFDKRNSLPSKIILLAVGAIVISNATSGFLISSFADQNWKYVEDLYSPSGKYFCYVGELPHGWAISVPCLKPVQNNTDISLPITSGPSVTFTPPVVTTSTVITSDSSSTVYGSPTTFTAMISPIPDNGEIQFQIDNQSTSNPVTIFGGQATFSTVLSSGKHRVYASYLGAPNFYPSSSPVDVTVLLASELENANLSHANLKGMNLSNANLEGANLSEANLQNANLSGADLSRSNLSEANLQNANLSSADLSQANLSSAILLGSNLDGTRTEGANFAGAITRGCIGCP